MQFLGALIDVEQTGDDLTTTFAVANVLFDLHPVMGVVTGGDGPEANDAAVVHRDLGCVVGGDLGADLGADRYEVSLDSFTS